MIQFVKSSSENINTVYTTMGHFEYEITPYLIQSVDWNKIFSLILSFREEYNDNSGRFLKSELISTGFERFSDGKFVYIDENGCDFYLPEKDCRVELKSGIHIFQTSRALSTVEVKLKNFNGNATAFEKTFDYLMLVEPHMVGVISYEKLQRYIYAKADGLYCKISFKDIELFKEACNVQYTNFNLTDIRKKIVESCLDEVERLYND